METGDGQHTAPKQEALETSLVEWKQRMSPPRPGPATPLGNFLSGMETIVSLPWFCGPQRLGNFLSGMETYQLAGFRAMDENLGNFLSGMETSNLLPRPAGRIPSLETSLVEWKHGGASPRPLLLQPLGNFLSGMETTLVVKLGAVQGAPWKLP